MPDKPFKQHERRVAALLRVQRCWANSGEQADVLTDDSVNQCKLVKEMSLAELTRLVVATDADAAKRGKPIGRVWVKLRLGSGHPTPTLVIQSIDSWQNEGDRTG